MTAKEKAKELFDKMYMLDDPMGNYPMCFDTAKQCALIAVYEIYNSGLLVFVDDEQYWHEVKQEIEKL
jgi:hypothetical protein